MTLDRKSVLIADDEEDLTWSISRYLQKHDDLFEVQCVSTGDDALDLLHNQHFDLVISDIRMPGINGLDLLRIVAQKWPLMNFIIMTAYRSDLIAGHLKLLNSSLYIEKPFELRYLRTLIYDSLRIPESWRNGARLSSRIKEIVAFNCQTLKTSQLRLHRGMFQGRIYFRRGEIVHAECGELEGENALTTILDWEKADSYADYHELTRKRTIKRNWQSLLNASMVD